MCQGEPNLTEVQMALQQLQVLTQHLQRSVRQWREYLEDSGQPGGRLQLQKAVHHARKLEEALLQAGHTLSSRDGEAGSRITITPLPPPQAERQHPHSHRGIGWP